MKMTLRIYVADDCWSCQETRRIAAAVAPQFPEVEIDIRQIGDDPPDDVFAVPTYALNGRVIFMGNPTRNELSQRVAAALRTVDV